MSRRPRRVTGKATPDPFDEVAQRRADAVADLTKTIWVGHPNQLLVMNKIRSYMRTNLGRRGVPLDGLRLSEDSQAGKSALVERLKLELAEEDLAAGREINRFRLVHITIDEFMTIKMLYKAILNQLKDDFLSEPLTGSQKDRSDRQNQMKVRQSDDVSDIEQRIAEWVVKLGVEVLVIDEVQRLKRKTGDATAVTKKLQSFIDRGVVPIVLIGDDTSRAFFRADKYLAARLGKPLKLEPLNEKVRADLKLFRDFCVSYDEQLVGGDAFPIASCLGDDDVLDGLMAVSRGHVGRVARILQTAAEEAARRGAAAIERYDLYNATEDLAIDIGWATDNPFRVPDGG